MWPKLDEFEKKFSALHITGPKDQFTVLMNAEEQEDSKSGTDFTELSKARPVELEKQLEKINSIISI